MTTYRERREARAERLRGWADGRDAKAAAAGARADQIMDAIPLGQPILVGHHSEGRHRRDLATLDRSMGAVVEHSRKAESMRSRAANIEAAAERAIYSDDPDAVERLTEKLAGLEAERDAIKAYNATARKGTPDLGLLTAKQRDGLASAWQHQAAYMERRKGQMPQYVLANLGGVIKATRDRLARLQAVTA